jgi:hypothetical protein
MTPLAHLLANLRPRLRTGAYVFVTVPGPDPRLHPVMTFAEDEGLTLILGQSQADGAGLPYGLVTAWITLTVDSALDDVGLTAAVSGALTEAGISCNVVAATHHDHLFVPVADADRAMAILSALG